MYCTVSVLYLTVHNGVSNAIKFNTVLLYLCADSAAKWSVTKTAQHTDTKRTTNKAQIDADKNYKIY